MTIGLADDDASADGERVLSYNQAVAAARAMSDTPQAKVHGLTVRQAMTRYVDHQSVNDLQSRGRTHILPTLGDLVVSELTAERLRKWLANLAATPAQTRPKDGKPQYQAQPQTAEDRRRRQASANRVLSMLKAMLNHAYDEGHVSHRDAWGRKLKPFRDVEMARVRYLTVAEAQRLLNAWIKSLRPLVRGALETGCRYSELARLQVSGFSTPTPGRSRSASPKPVNRATLCSLTKALCFSGGHDLIFRHADGSRWKASEQARPMRAASSNARLSPPITFHGLRHSWASLSAMAGVPLLVIAKNLGHSDTRMVEKHYGHLAPSYIAEAIRAGAPRFSISRIKSNAAAITKIRSRFLPTHPQLTPIAKSSKQTLCAYMCVCVFNRY